MTTIGVLALQGDFQEHIVKLSGINVRPVEVRLPGELDGLAGLIIPGGESTVIADLLVRLQMADAFTTFIRTRPVWGTCAGMILLARQVNDNSINPYGVIDIAVDRNGYGRQFHSTVIPARLSLNGSSEQVEMVFIRAPRVTAVGPGVEVLLRRDQDPVLLCQNNILVSAFHPELTGSSFLHNYFARRFVSA